MCKKLAMVAAGTLGLGALVAGSSTPMLRTAGVETAIVEGLAAQFPDGSCIVV